MGREVGISDGTSEGASEGLAEGVADGLAVGLDEGLADGLAEGLADGVAEGLADGVALGAADGNAEGAAVGTAEGEALGAAVGLIRMNFCSISKSSPLQVDLYRLANPVRSKDDSHKGVSSSVSPTQIPNESSLGSVPRQSSNLAAELPLHLMEALTLVSPTLNLNVAFFFNAVSSSVSHSKRMVSCSQTNWAAAMVERRSNRESLENMMRFCLVVRRNC